MLWDANEDNLPIALYHGSLDRELRRRTEAMMAAGKIRNVVATAALELGIDWGDVDLVIQVAAPKGVSRLLQRVGRSNHRLDVPSRAFLVPANRFEALECQAALTAIEHGQLDGEPPSPGSLDVVAQHILSCACCEPVHPDTLFEEIRTALPYAALDRATFDRLFQFAIDGGYVLRGYDRYRRLMPLPDGRYRIANAATVRRHRQNIGVIVEAARLKVKRIAGSAGGTGSAGATSRGGRILGEVEEYFAQGLTPGDTFFFAGEVLSFAGIRDMIVEARPAPGGEPKIPAYSGGQMPLSTFLADGVRALLAQPANGGNSRTRCANGWICRRVFQPSQPRTGCWSSTSANAAIIPFSTPSPAARRTRRSACSSRAAWSIWASNRSAFSSPITGW